MVELVDTYGLGPYAQKRESSSLSTRTLFLNLIVMKRNESKALARAKRLYERLKDMPLIKKADGKWRACESITEFLSLKWVQVYKESKFKKGVSEKLDAKQKNRKERHSKKDIIEEGLQVYKSEYDEDPTCGNCEWFNKGECLESGEQVYADDPVCKEFRD